MTVAIDPSISPRLISVPISDGVSITIQSLHDQLKQWEERPENLSYPLMVLSAGKTALGGGTFTGITATLQDAQLEFEARVIALELGTITTGDTTGTILIDSLATFEANGVERGNMIVNFDDRSLSVVLTVDSEIQLTTKQLQTGVINQYTFGDNYSVYEVVQCTVSAGNLVAEDVNGDIIDSISPSANTQVVVESDTSAALLGGKVNVGAIDDSEAAARKLRKSADSMVEGTVDDANFTPSTTQFEAADIVEDDANQFNGRVVIFITGDRIKLATDITAYSLDTGRGHFTVTTMNEPPADGDTFIIV